MATETGSVSLNDIIEDQLNAGMITTEEAIEMRLRALTDLPPLPGPEIAAMRMDSIEQRLAALERYPVAANVIRSGELRPGDIIVFTSQRYMAGPGHMNFIDSVNKALPDGVRVLLLEGDVAITDIILVNAREDTVEP